MPSMSLKSVPDLGIRTLRINRKGANESIATMKRTPANVNGGTSSNPILMKSQVEPQMALSSSQTRIGLFICSISQPSFWEEAEYVRRCRKLSYCRALRHRVALFIRGRPHPFSTERGVFV